MYSVDLKLETNYISGSDVSSQLQQATADVQLSTHGSQMERSLFVLEDRGK